MLSLTVCDFVCAYVCEGGRGPLRSHLEGVTLLPNIQHWHIMGGGAAVGQHGQKTAWLNVLGAHATKEERHITDLDRGQDEGRGPSSRGDMMKNIFFFFRSTTSMPLKKKILSPTRTCSPSQHNVFTLWVESSARLPACQMSKCFARQCILGDSWCCSSNWITFVSHF